MDLKPYIVATYRDMKESYDGFGHGVADVPFNPCEVLETTDLLPDESTGVIVVLLAWLSDAIDETTYEDAIACKLFKRTRRLSDRGVFDAEPTLKQAVNAAFESESKFRRCLEQVYRKTVVPALESNAA